MSNEINTNLLERAARAIDYFEGKLPAVLIEQDLELNDLTALRNHVALAELEMEMEEFAPDYVPEIDGGEVLDV